MEVISVVSVFLFLQVTGEANETQICEALRRYSEREGFVREALFHLFSLTHAIEKPRPDILKVRTHRDREMNQSSLHLSVSTLMSLLGPSAVGRVGDEESSGHIECAAGSQCLCVQPHQTGTGLWNPCAAPGERHTAATRSHEDLPQPPTGTQNNAEVCGIEKSVMVKIK